MNQYLYAGFIKTAANQGVEPEFIMGFLKHAEEVTEVFAQKINEMEKQSSDPLYRAKLAYEIFTKAPRIKKAAEGTIPEGMQEVPGLEYTAPKAPSWLQTGTDMVNGLFNSKLSPGWIGGIGGGGGGSLIGLILANLLGIDPIWGLLGGAAIGSGVGAGFGSGFIDNLMNSGNSDELKKQIDNTVESNLRGGATPENAVNAGNQAAQQLQRDKKLVLPQDGDKVMTQTPEAITSEINAKRDVVNTFDPENIPEEMVSANDTKELYAPLGLTKAYTGVPWAKIDRSRLYTTPTTQPMAWEAALGKHTKDTNPTPIGINTLNPNQNSTWVSNDASVARPNLTEPGPISKAFAPTKPNPAAPTY